MMLATGLIVAGSPAAAATAPIGITVRYTPADLASASGRKALDRRLQRAASQVCPIIGRDLVQASACQYASYGQAEADLARAVGAGRLRVVRAPATAKTAD